MTAATKGAGAGKNTIETALRKTECHPSTSRGPGSLYARASGGPANWPAFSS